MATGSSALVSLGLLRERLPGERRVALTPADVKRLSAKAIVTVETGAGLEAGFPDDAYANAGAHLADLQQVLDGSAVIAKVRAPDASQTPRAGGVLISRSAAATPAWKNGFKSGQSPISLLNVCRG